MWVAVPELSLEREEVVATVLNSHMCGTHHLQHTLVLELQIDASVEPQEGPFFLKARVRSGHVAFRTFGFLYKTFSFVRENLQALNALSLKASSCQSSWGGGLGFSNHLWGVWMNSASSVPSDCFVRS